MGVITSVVWGNAILGHNLSVLREFDALSKANGLTKVVLSAKYRRLA
jgi:hypothetical protein